MKEDSIDLLESNEIGQPEFLQKVSYGDSLILSHKEVKSNESSLEEQWQISHPSSDGSASAWDQYESGEEEAPDDNALIDLWSCEQYIHNPMLRSKFKTKTEPGWILDLISEMKGVETNKDQLKYKMHAKVYFEK